MNLSKKEKLGKVRDTIKKAVRDNEEQLHLVAKYLETDSKLGYRNESWSWSMTELDKYLEKLH